jgi:membrane-associated phospholipid phosphatase
MNKTRRASLLLTLAVAALPAGAAGVPLRPADLYDPVGPPAPDGLAAPGAAQASPAHTSDGRRTLGRLPQNLGRGLVGVFHRDSLAPLLVGGAATALASAVDDSVRDAVADPESGFGKALETAGGGLYGSLFVGAMFAGGRLSHGRFRAMTYDMLSAAIVNEGYTQILKVTVRRERPDGSNDQSFPSGHTSNAFTLATVAERHYGWKIGVPAYAVAAAIGYSRLVRDKHYLSDAVAGATLGYIVGRAVVRVDGEAFPARRHAASFDVSPILGPRLAGLRLQVVF